MATRAKKKKTPTATALRRLALQQKHGDLDQLTRQTEQAIRGAYIDARLSVGAVLAEFARAYGLERARLKALHEDDDDESAPAPRVPLVWLKSSGWGQRLQHVMRSASHNATSQSRATLLHSWTAAHQLGTSHAQQLLVEAMRPATERGLSWRPR